MYALYWDIMMYCDPSKAVTGKRPARSEKSAESRNRDDGWMVAKRLIDGCSSSLYAARYSEMVSSEMGGVLRCGSVAMGSVEVVVVSRACRVERTPERDA